MFLEKELARISEIIQNDDQLNPGVSSKGTYWHTDHILKVMISISKALKKSDPADYRWRFNFWRFSIFVIGFIPRGSGRAPRRVQSFDPVSREALSQEFDEVLTMMSELEHLPARSYFKHPYFGMMNLSNAQWFLKIHTRHHLKIIRDIRRGNT